MSGQNYQTGAIHIDEGHHRELVRHVWGGRRARLSPPLVAIVQRSFIAMVAISDNEFFVLHATANEFYQRWIRNFPELMENAVFVANFSRRGRRSRKCVP